MSSRFPFPMYPNGWFAIGFSSDFPTAEVKTCRAFGQDIVLYRAPSGEVRATDPYCPHLGAHLGHGGRVVGDRLRCPFHGWCFDGAGKCVEVPGATRVPARAELRTWPVAELDGLVFVHHHAGGAAPSWEVPRLPSEGWSEDTTVLWTLRTHPQEVFENVIDAAHLVPLHGCQRATIARGPVMTDHSLNVLLNLIADGSIIGMSGLVNDVTLDVTMYGLGQAIVQTDVRNVGLSARQRIYCTPIDENQTEIRGMVSVRDLGDDIATNLVAGLFHQAYVVDFAMDFPVWENKIYREKPILSSADGPFMQYRRWAQRFYGGGRAAEVAEQQAIS